MKFTTRRLTAILGLALLTAASASLEAKVVNRIVLRVNDRIATLYDYETRKADRLRALGAQTGIDSAQREQMVGEVGRVVMREIFDELLVLSRADQLGITASPEQIEESMIVMRKRSGIETDEQFRMALAQSGLTYDDLRGQVERNIVWEGVVARDIAPTVEVDEAALRNYYRAHQDEFQVPEQVELQEIVVLADEATGENPVDLAAEIHQKLVDGQSMEAVSEEYSPRVSSVIGLDWVNPGDLDPTLEGVVWQLEPDQISEPIAGRGGLHIFQALGRHDASVQPFNEVGDRIYSIERDRLFNDAIQTYIADLEDSSYYSGDVPEDAKGFRSASGRAVLEESIQHFEIRPLNDGGKEAADTETEPSNR